MNTRGDIVNSTRVYITSIFKALYLNLTGHMTWAFCLMIRNTLIMCCKELKFSTESESMPL